MEKFSVVIPSIDEMEEMGFPLKSDKYNRFIDFLIGYIDVGEEDYYFGIISYFYEVFNRQIDY